jgi:hypothetical protein
MLSRGHGGTGKPLKPIALHSSAPPRLRERTGFRSGKVRMFSQRRGDAEKPLFKVLLGVLASWRLGVLAPWREIRVHVWRNPMLSRGHGGTGKPLKPIALHSSAPPRLRERTGFRSGKVRMFSQRRGDAEKPLFKVLLGVLASWRLGALARDPGSCLEGTRCAHGGTETWGNH